MHTTAIFDQTVHTGTSLLTRYDGIKTLAGIPSCNDIVAEFDNGMFTILQQHLSDKQPIYFMPTDVSDEAKYINGVSTYILRISDTLINRQKAIVDITGIKPFFDAEVPDNYSSAGPRGITSFKTILACILSTTLKSTSKFGFENVHAFSLQEYYTEKKAYICDRTFVLTWDIETYSSLGLGKFPTAQSDESNVFMICMSVHWKDDPNPLKQICLVDVEIAPDPCWTTIICGNQKNLLKAFTLCWKLLASDIQIGFNDSQYDWPFIVEKAKKLGQYQYNAIKVNDRDFHSKHLKIPGCIAIDVQSCLMKFYPKGKKSSLAYYLKECNLDNKVNMPFYRMFKYYEQALKGANTTTIKQMHKIAYYCIIDALSCQQLMIKHNTINEYREVASIAFLSLFNAHYFAGGMKVCNLLDASAWQDGILTSMIQYKQTETGKYPGAYVFTPIKELENRCPVTGLDFTSLYPNLIITYNLSPDKIILSEEQALSVELQHNNISKEKELYANVLKYLSGKRNEMKKRLAPLKEKKEDMDLIISSMDKGLSLLEAIEQVLANIEEEKHAGITKNLYHFINKKKHVEHEFMTEYDSVCSDCSCLDAKQYAFKVYMNTFYRTAGDSKSPFFLCELAGCVTSAGQRNIKLVADFIKNKRFGIKYGDTDFLYLVCSKECFQECDEAYNNGKISKEEYWSRMVKISMEEIEKLRDEIDLNEIIKTAVWKLDKNNKSGLTPEPYLYEISEPGERFEYIVVENDLSQKVGDKMEYSEVARCLDKKIDINYYLKNIVGLCACFINYEDRYQPSSETLLEALRKLKDDNKVGDSLAQKSAKNIYAKKLYDTIYANKIVKCSGNDAYWSSFLSALDKQEESIRIKLTTLLAEIFQDDIRSREEMYKLVTKASKHKSKAMTLEKYMLTYIQENGYEILADLWNTWYKMVGLEITRYQASSKLQGDKKDNSPEVNIDKIIELYG
ncbi:11880_t:CDS:2 [Cetraspora pellucida]|uniref:11880_t:CDS:1 n=1 Tax=Cetraspora pellucida TaxID=1433469 RepID=A0ACA9M511_9GLOM|nr:11880_t:CDS:2 [Cetraspora pellucida]